MENTPLVFATKVDVKVLYQRKQIMLKNGALATMLLGENYPGLPFPSRSAPSNSVVQIAGCAASVLKGTSIFLNCGIIHSVTYMWAIFRMCRLETIHFTFTWGFGLYFMLRREFSVKISCSLGGGK